MRTALLFLFAMSLAAQPASVEGVVMDRSTGQPLRGVHLRLVTGDFGNGGGLIAVYGATSDATGHFSSTNMKSGLYMVTAERNSFVQIPAKQGSPVPYAAITLKAGQHVADYTVEMLPSARIAGRVVDEYGDPVESIFVQLEPVPPDRGQETTFGGGGAATDERGEFHLLASPGKYYLHTQGFRFVGIAEIHTDGTSGAPFVATYFPHGETTAAASVVQVAAGQDLAGLEIRLTRSAASATKQSLTVSGTVSGIPANSSATVLLGFGSAPDRAYALREVTAGPDGRFTFTGMQPGFGDVRAIFRSGKRSLQSRVLTF